MDRNTILHWLKESDPQRLADLWHTADQQRRACVGDEVQLRGLVEISNHCRRRCLYCGLRAENTTLLRYRMSDDEILACAHQATEFGFGTLVLQSGEDPAFDGRRVAQLVRRIKQETSLAVTLSLGERSPAELAAWREAGADRYLLRFETSNVSLYRRIHPLPGSSRNFAACVPSLSGQSIERLRLLGVLRRLGYEVGSGMMIGIPSQTYEDLAADIALFAELELDMIGVGPYLRHPATPMADAGRWPDAPPDQQAPADELTTCKVIALARLVCPWANIPATTALAVQGGAEAWKRGLQCGANVLMPNLTPKKYREQYEIYPGKAQAGLENILDGQPLRRLPDLLKVFLAEIGRRPGSGRGDSPAFLRRNPTRTLPATVDG